LNWVRHALNTYRQHCVFRSILTHRSVSNDSDPLFVKVKELVGDAFNLTNSQSRKLTRSDKLSWIYEGVAGAVSDRFENENLQLRVEHELGRKIPEAEASKIVTIGDLVDLFKRENPSY